MTPLIDLTVIDGLTAGRIGAYDVPCPACGPYRRSPANKRRRTLRIWRIEPGYATYHCARCGAKGYARDGSAPPPDVAKLARAHAEAGEHERVAKAERSRLALHLWRHRQPIAGSIAERYLRDARAYRGPLPATLGFLPARAEHSPAMIAAFGLATEPEPGALAIEYGAVRGVHLTRLTRDGSGKAGSHNDKIMIGHSIGCPIVLAPPNDLLGIIIAEGAEDALSAHEATGLGAWAAGSASRLPTLADAIPAYIECATVLVDNDLDGRRYGAELAKRLNERTDLDVRPINLAMQRAAA